jgi:hypothetical protein
MMSHGRESSSPRPPRRVLGRGVEWEFLRLSISGGLSRSVVTRLLTDRAEYGGWELDQYESVAMASAG